MKRKAIILALCASMALSVPMGVSATSVTDFTDVPADSWYYDDVKGAVDHGYMNGTSGSTFDPSNQMTRAMATTVFARFDEAVVDDSKPTIFTDVPVNQWYTGSIAWANEQKLVEGVGDNRFSPNNFISRQDMAVIMDRYIKNKGYSLKESPLIDSFKDASSISDYAREAVENCRKYGLINGYDDGTFGPKTDINRAQAAAMFERMKVVVDNNQITPEPPKPSGGGSGGSSSARYMDYTVQLKAGRFDAYSIDNEGDANQKDDIEYHINLNSSSNSDTNDFYEVIKKVFTENRIEDQILDKVTVERTKVHVSDNVGDQYLITKENDDKYLNAEFVIKYVTMQDVFGVATGDPTDESIANDVCEAVATKLGKTNAEVVDAVNDVIDLLNNKNDEKLEDTTQIEVAKQLKGELKSLIDNPGEGGLWDKVQKKAGMSEDALRNLGITKGNIDTQAKDYLAVLERMTEGTSTFSAANVSMYAAGSSAADDSSAQGIAVTINIGTIIENVYNDQKAKIISDGDLWKELDPKVTYEQIGSEVMTLYNACNPMYKFVERGNADSEGNVKYKINNAKSVKEGIDEIIDAIKGLHNKLVDTDLDTKDVLTVLGTCCQQFGIEYLDVSDADVIFKYKNPKLTQITTQDKTLNITVRLDRTFFNDEIENQLKKGTTDESGVTADDITEIVTNIVNKIPVDNKTAQIVITATSCEETNTH